MVCINKDYRERTEARLAKKEAQIALLETAYYSALESGNIKEYSFNSAEAWQRTKYHSLKEMQDAIDRLEKEIDALRRNYNGQGVINLKLRRTGGVCTSSYRQII